MAQRFEGKNLDEALDHAAQALGVDRYRIHHSVILEKRGFLGGVKRVVIEADINDDAVAPPPAPAPAPVPEPETPVASALPSSRPERPRERGGRGRGNARGGGDDRRGGRGRGRERRHDDELRPGDFEHHFGASEAAPIPEQGSESDAARSVREWCEEVIDLTRLDLVVRTEENEAQIHVRLYGRDTPRLVDHHGEALDALQVLANKALAGRKTEKDIELDCEDFKSQRHDELQRQARELADQVRRDGREQLLPAMTPIERRIVHLALQDDAEVATESRGEGFYKRVAIVPRAQQDETPAAP